MKVVLQLVLYALGAVLATEEEEVPVGTLRQTLHGTSARVVPTTIEEALTVTSSEGASHFQKLPGELLKIFEKQGSVFDLILSFAAGAFELAGYAHIEFQIPLST